MSAKLAKVVRKMVAGKAEARIVEVTVVNGDDTCDVETRGATLESIPVLSSYPPEVGDAALLLKTEKQAVLLGGFGPYVGGGGGGTPITVSSTAPSSPATNDLWVEI